MKIVEPSPDRIEPRCEHFGTCGGCKWQILPYDQQLVYKRRHVKNALKRIGHLDVPHVAGIIGSEDIYFYRNKLEFSFCNNRWLSIEEIENGAENIDRRAAGFNIQGRFDRVLDIKKCWLQDDIVNSIRISLKEFCIEKNIPLFDIINNEGFLRSIFTRTTLTGELMLIVVFYYDDETYKTLVINHLKDTFPEITSLVYTILTKGSTVLSDAHIKLWSGKDHMMEQMEDLFFKISPKSFYQTNAKQAYNLYKATRECADLKGDELVYDLYTGTGTIANFIARKTKKVIGIEYVEDAIVDAKINSEINGISNTLFFAGDMKDILNEDFIVTHGKPDVIITDPPRAGMHPDVIKTILNASPEKIVYVSCNPATQARDLQLLNEQYKITRVQPVDMFPHTAHVENIAVLVKRDKILSDLLQ